MTATSETQKTGKAAKVLAAAEELVLKQGFKGVTMAAVAQRAHVGKGTPYLYWRTKEDIFLELIARNLADMLHELAARVRVDPGLALADQLCAAVADDWLARPLVRALQISDTDVLGALLDDPRTHAIVAENGAAAVLRQLLPVWRDHDTVRTDWSIEEQTSALELVLVGYFATQTRSIASGTHMDRALVLRLAISSMLQTRPSGAGDGEVLAHEVSTVLDAHARRLRESAA